MRDKKVYKERRERLLREMGPGAAVLPGATVTFRNSDIEHDFRQESDFFYLTGFAEPNAVLLLTNQHPDHRFVLFVRPRDPERERWEGPRAGCDGARSVWGADAAFPIDELAARLPEYLIHIPRVYYRLGVNRPFDDKFLDALNATRRRAREGIAGPRELFDTSSLLHEYRLRKSADEIEAMTRAAEITRQGHASAMQIARPGRYEYQVEAELTRVFRAHGSERAAYGSIVASGPNATFLHYRNNDRQIREGELVLIDAAAEYDYLASDVTRTFPANGAFSAEQRSIYDLVLDAQQAAIEKVRPGSTLAEVHAAAVDVITRGLVSLGLILGPLDQALSEQTYKPYFMHRTSHWLGMDAHDVGDYFVDGKPRPLQQGFALTVEPGVYISTEAPVDERWRGIGVRIEDNLVVTADGYSNITADIPKTASELESLTRVSRQRRLRWPKMKPVLPRGS
jgi:Xaa-Pro aminopeptidase